MVVTAWAQFALDSVVARDERNLNIAKVEVDPRLARLAQLVRERLAGAPACHDADHTFRVLHNAMEIAGRETGVDLAVITAAALLHDLGRAEEMAQQGKVCHAMLGAELAPRMLHECGFTDPTFIAHVAGCVRTHRFRGEMSPATLEAKVIYDADKLDSIGAIGIGRAFHFAGRIGARVHNRADEALAGASYGREDSAYREYLVKLRKVKDGMLTVAGRELAAARAARMEQFFAALNEEVFGVQDPDCTLAK